jgi:hypothetical protein
MGDIQFPERWFKVRFDIWGASHQVLHVAVVLAGLAHLRGLIAAFEHARGISVPDMAVAALASALDSDMAASALSLE